MVALGDLVTGSAVFERDPAHHVQFKQQLDRPEDGCTADSRHFGEQVFYREWSRSIADGIQYRPPGSGRPEADEFEPG